MKIGITGGIGSGKTTVCRLLQTMGYPVFNADISGKYICNTDIEVKKALIEHFSSAIYTASGELDRVRFASIIFNDPSLLLIANNIIHPAVFQAFNEWVQIQSSPFVFIESAILLESILADKIDKIIVVTASESERISRVINRGGMTLEQIRARMQNQLSEKELLLKADYIIDNSDNKLIIPQVENIIASLNALL